MSTRRLGRAALAVCAVVLGASACGGDSGGGGKDAAGTTTTAPARSSSTTAASTTTTSAAAGTAAPTTVPRGVGSGTGASSSTTKPPASPTTAASTNTAAGTTRPGRYRYATNGTFSAGVGAEQRQDGESVLTVDPAIGSDQHSVRVGPGRTSEQVVRFQGDGTYLVMLKLTEQGLVKEFRPPSPVLALPHGAPVGRTWSWRITSTDGQTTVDASFRLERNESVQVGTASVPAVVVQGTLVTSGDVASKGTQTLWVSEARRLIVREQAITDGTFGTFRFRSTSDARILSLDPS